VGEEALIESIHVLILCPPLISRFFKILLLGMGMYPGAAGGFCATVLVLPPPLIPVLVSDTTTFC
jgi:hypothetical protein